MSEDHVESHYQGAAGRNYHEQKRRLPPQAEAWMAKYRRDKLVSFVTPEDVVFEFGLGYGWNLMRLDCRRRMGCDISTFLASELEAKGIEFVTDISQLERGSVDVVVCHHALEHVLEPAQTLSRLHRLLGVDGRLLLFVPYERERRYRRYDPEEPNHHLYSWNVQSLAALVAHLGYEIVQADLRVYGQERAAALLAHRMKAGEPGFHLLKRLGQWLKRQREVRIIAQKK